MDMKKWLLLSIGVLSLVLIICLVNTDFKQAKKDKEAKKIVSEKFEELISIHTFDKVFKIDDEQIRIDELLYKKILNYEEVINNTFTENGKQIINENLRKYVLTIGDNYYLKLDELNFETEYKKHRFEKVEVLNEKLNFKIKSQINFIDQKGTLDNQITLIKEKDKWLIDTYELGKYNYVYKS